METEEKNREERWLNRKSKEEMSQKKDMGFMNSCNRIPNRKLRNVTDKDHFISGHKYIFFDYLGPHYISKSS